VSWWGISEGSRSRGFKVSRVKELKSMMLSSGKRKGARSQGVEGARVKKDSGSIPNSAKMMSFL
jgi:hypothetical protein